MSGAKRFQTKDLPVVPGKMVSRGASHRSQADDDHIEITHGLPRLPVSRNDRPEHSLAGQFLLHHLAHRAPFRAKTAGLQLALDGLHHRAHVLWRELLASDPGKIGEHFCN
jgi:hypothetical protein